MICKNRFQGKGFILLHCVYLFICMGSIVFAQRPTELVCIIPIEGPHTELSLFTQYPFNPRVSNILTRECGTDFDPAADSSIIEFTRPNDDAVRPFFGAVVNMTTRVLDRQLRVHNQRFCKFKYTVYDGLNCQSNCIVLPDETCDGRCTCRTPEYPISGVGVYGYTYFLPITSYAETIELSVRVSSTCCDPVNDPLCTDDPMYRSQGGCLNLRINAP